MTTSVPAHARRPTTGTRRADSKERALGVQATRAPPVDAEAGQPPTEGERRPVEVAGWLAERPDDLLRPDDLVHPDGHGRAIDNWRQMVTLIDVADEVAAAETVRRHEQLLRRLVESVPVGIVHVAPDRTVDYANSRLLDLLGVDRLANAGDLRAAVPEDQRPTLEDALDAALETGEGSELELTLRRGADSPALRCRLTITVVFDGTTVIGALACAVDVTTLRQEASLDPLTRLANRTAILELLGQALVAGPSPVGLIFVDLDDFKAVNDRFGHAGGDEVLRDVAAALQGAVRRNDHVGRIGGDEFLVVCPGTEDAGALEAVVSRIDARVAAVFASADGLRVSATAGVVVVAGSETAEEAVGLADAAMYSAKAAKAKAATTGGARRPRLPAANDVGGGHPSAGAVG